MNNSQQPEPKRHRQSPQDAVLEYLKYLRENGYDGTTAQPTMKAYFKYLKKDKPHEQPDKNRDN